MINIRQGCFECNSSSCHSICISKTPVQYCYNRVINFRFDDFGWSEETCYNTEDYLYTAIVCSDLTPKEVKDYLDRLKKILDKYGTDYSFEPYKIVHSEYGDFCTPKDDEHCWGVGIDHAREVLPLVDRLLNDENLLMRYLFGDSVIYTGNDNGCEHDSKCFSAFDSYYNDDDQLAANPNHQPDKYDYFFKGN